MGLAGGIDLGGTKIDAQLFDPDEGWTRVRNHEVPTPRNDYDTLVSALAQQVRWLTDQGAACVGVGAPGLIAASGLAVTANLPATGRPLPADLNDATGHEVPFLNDCRAFTLSEAVLGAGRGAGTVLGCIIGTGLAGGIARNGVLIDGPNGQAGEFGHAPLPHGPMHRHKLPSLTCGCGRIGCYETLCAGPGLSRLAEILTGDASRPEDLAAHARAGDIRALKVMDVWSELVGEMLISLTLTLDPDVIVLGGGLSKMPELPQRLSAALAPRLLSGTTAPRILAAQGGDRSGARGAALSAHQRLTEGNPHV